MRTIKWRLETGFAAVEHEGEIEVMNDATDDEIEADVKEDVWNRMSLSWWPADEKITED